MSRPGRINRRVELRRDTGTTQDEFGAHLEEWTLIGSRWAEIQPGKGGEVFAEESERAKQAVTIVIRRDELTKTLTPADRIVDTDGIEYDIQSVSDRLTAHRYVEILALRRSPEANRVS